MSDRPIFLAGRWRTGRGRKIRSINPANGDLIAEFPGASVQDVEEAVSVGLQAARGSSWKDLKAHERARYLHRIANGIRSNAKEISALQTSDTGKTLSETFALAMSAAGTFQYMAAALETLEDAVTPSRGNYLTMSAHEPIGVVAAITPWNSPIASDAQKLAPALAAGNAVIVKPAEWASLTSLKLAEICEDAGLPEGVLSVLPGPGRVIGEAIVKHASVGMVSFTGGTSTGRHIARIAADKLMPVSLELGGKSPTIVFADADFQHAIDGILLGIFSSTGQSCVAGSRLFVERSIYDAFVPSLVERTKALAMGSPTDSGSQIGPLISFEHRDAVADYVELARSEGATALCGGAIPTGPVYVNGAFYPPTILADLENSARTCQEEIFGPVLVVMPFDDEEELIASANDSVYGLACGLWTNDYKKAYRVARRIEAGTVWINTYKQLSISTPFGGCKQSGIGREKAREGIRRYMEQKSLYWGINEDPLPWANQGIPLSGP